MGMKLQNKKAIVTGASRSIGKAISIALAKQGADVIISYRTDEIGAKACVAEIESLGRIAKALYVDFSKPLEVTSFFDNAVAFLGRVDILVNNAAGYDTTPFLDLDIEVFEKVLWLGASVPVMLTQLAAKHMIKENLPGSIINISSTSGLRPYPNRVAHSAAKAALNMVTQSTALELAPYGIRVNAVAPGYTPYEGEVIDTELLAGIPLQRAGSPEDTAKAVLYLAANDSNWMTGQILSIDGGHSLSY